MTGRASTSRGRREHSVELLLVEVRGHVGGRAAAIVNRELRRGLREGDPLQRRRRAPRISIPGRRLLLFEARRDICVEGRSAGSGQNGDCEPRARPACALPSQPWFVPGHARHAASFTADPAARARATSTCVESRVHDRLSVPTRCAKCASRDTPADGWAARQRERDRLAQHRECGSRGAASTSNHRTVAAPTGAGPRTHSPNAEEINK